MDRVNALSSWSGTNQALGSAKDRSERSVEPHLASYFMPCSTRRTRSRNQPNERNDDMALDDVLRDVSADNAWESVLHITSEIPSRLAGSPNARRMAEFAGDKLRQAGLESRLDEFLGLVSFPEPATVWALSPEQFTIE